MIEKALIDGAGYDYQTAHEFATIGEHAFVRKAGLTPRNNTKALFANSSKPTIVRGWSAYHPIWILTPYSDEQDRPVLLRLLRFVSKGDTGGPGDSGNSEEVAQLPETKLHENPFWILSASTRDNRQRIVELAEEKALVLDPDVCQRARATLTTPRPRLSAEVSWLPGVSPNRAWQIATALRGGFVDPVIDAGLPPLARSNILSATFEVLSTKNSTRRVDQTDPCACKFGGGD